MYIPTCACINPCFLFAAVPAEFVFVPLLTVTAGLVGSRGKIVVNECDGDEEGCAWEEPSILWTAVIGLPVSYDYYHNFLCLFVIAQPNYNSLP